MSNLIREQLHKQIDKLPDEVVEQIADFTLFVMARKQIVPDYEEWEWNDWQTLALEHFFDDEDDVTYSLEDAQEVLQQ